MNRIENLLRQRIGLDATSIGSSLIARVVRLRMKSLGLSEPEVYERILSSSKQEWDELVESLVVTETWFFRDAGSFTGFARLVAENWLPQHPVGTLRILSLPCSSGEEPYSLAMVLADACMPSDRVHIEGVDISARALKRARRGVYGKNAFRGDNLAFRDRHFQKTPEGYTLNANIRKQVQFYLENLLSDSFSPRYPSYDFIFCRNLLIYLNDTARRNALRRIHRLLAPWGYLFVGPAELPLAVDNGFVSADIPMGFVCAKKTHLDSVASKASTSKSKIGPKSRTPSPTLTAQSAIRSLRAQNSADLESARGLVDQGKLNEAFALCEKLLRRREINGDPESSYYDTAEVYYLMGVLHEAMLEQTKAETRNLRRSAFDARSSNGFDHAMDCYRKALYLNPDHHAALAQSAQLAAKTGDANAAALRRRLRRLEARINARATVNGLQSKPKAANLEFRNKL